MVGREREGERGGRGSESESESESKSERERESRAQDGRHYSGEWREGRAWGEGTLTLADGTVKSGRFEPCPAPW